MGGNQKGPTVGKTYEIDQRAVKIFSSWLPDSWLSRKQEPDFFIDFLVEIANNGEPSGLNFAAQVKGFEDNPKTPRLLSYPFKTKHLRYYRDRSQHPVFLFLINVSTGEGYWVFAQRLLKQEVAPSVLDEQISLTIQFSKEDDLLNITKFRCLLPDAEKFVRDLHPGSVPAALQKRKTELESMDPRCSVSLSVLNGREHIAIHPKQKFSFKTSIQLPDEASWNDFFEKGKTLTVKHQDFECTDFPLFIEMLKSMGDEVQIRYGREMSGSVHVISKAEPGTVIPIQGKFWRGGKSLNFHGELPESPLSLSFDVALEAMAKGDRFHLSVSFQPKNWIGQPILQLAYFDQVASFLIAFSATAAPEMELFINGNSVTKARVDGAEIGTGISRYLDWFHRCRWLAKHFNVNPPLPRFEKLGDREFQVIDEAYDLIRNLGSTVPQSDAEVRCSGDKVLSEVEIIGSDKILQMDLPDQKFDFWGTEIKLGTIRHVLTEMELASQIRADGGEVKVVFRGTDNTKRTTTLITA